MLIFKRRNLNILARKVLFTKSMVNILKPYWNFPAFSYVQNTTLLYKVLCRRVKNKVK